MNRHSFQKVPKSDIDKIILYGTVGYQVFKGGIQSKMDYCPNDI